MKQRNVRRQQCSEAGELVYRHAEPGASLGPVPGAGSVEAIVAHVERHLGPVSGVYTEIVPYEAMVEVLIVEPAETRPFTTLVTAGMSSRPMNPPRESADERLAELVLALPAKWPLSDEAFAAETVYWPVRLLKTLARLPHNYRTWLWAGHTVPNGDPPLPYAEGTRLCGAVLLTPVLAPDEFEHLTTPLGTVQFFSVIPVYAEELELKLEHGARALATALDGRGLSELLDPTRRSAV